jgi:Domain of unknown function (DUF427)
MPVLVRAVKGTCNWVDFVDPSGRTVEDVTWVYPKTFPGHEAIVENFDFYAGSRNGNK